MLYILLSTDAIVLSLPLTPLHSLSLPPKALLYSLHTLLPKWISGLRPEGGRNLLDLQDFVSEASRRIIADLLDSPALFRGNHRENQDLDILEHPIQQPFRQNIPKIFCQFGKSSYFCTRFLQKIASVAEQTFRGFPTEITHGGRSSAG